MLAVSRAEKTKRVAGAGHRGNIGSGLKLFNGFLGVVHLRRL